MPDLPVLQGVRILDFSWVLAGPFATRILADFGAEVIKVQPLTPVADDTFSRGYYQTFNRNKLGITLNLDKAEGRDIARQLVKLSDAVVENFSPRVMFNWGLDYQELRKVKPDLIFLSLSLMGHDGPWKDYSGFGLTAQAFSGIDRLNALPGQTPIGLGYALADHIAGLYGSLTLVSALEYRRQTGQGQFIDLSETEAMTSLLSRAFVDHFKKDAGGGKAGIDQDECTLEGIYPTLGKDRWCAISIKTPNDWERFITCLGNPAWARQEKFSSPGERKSHSEELNRLIEQWTIRHTAEEVMGILQKEGLAAGVVQSAADLSVDPQLKARRFFIETEDEFQQKHFADANPINLSENPPTYRRGAPAQGQDNLEIYSRLLGYSPAELARLKQEQVIG